MAKKNKMDQLKCKEKIESEIYHFYTKLIAKIEKKKIVFLVFSQISDHNLNANFLETRSIEQQSLL